jgi:hypothetical protein
MCKSYYCYKLDVNHLRVICTNIDDTGDTEYCKDVEENISSILQGWNSAESL